MDDPWGRPFWPCSRGAYGAVHSNSGCTIHETREYSLSEPTGTTHLWYFNHESRRHSRSYARLNSIIVALVRRRLDDLNPSAMNCDNRRHWSVEHVPYINLLAWKWENHVPQATIIGGVRWIFPRTYLSPKSAQSGGNFPLLQGPSHFPVNGPRRSSVMFACTKSMAICC